MLPYAHIDYKLQLKNKESIRNKSYYEIQKTLEYDEKLPQKIREHFVKNEFKSLFETQDPIVPMVNVKKEKKLYFYLICFNIIRPVWIIINPVINMKLVLDWTDTKKQSAKICIITMKENEILMVCLFF